MTYRLAIAAIALVLASAGAKADTLNVTCSNSELISGNITTCGNSARYKFSSEGTGNVYAVRLQAPSTHCSDVRYSVSNRETGESYGQTAWLAPGEEETLNIGDAFARGTHILRIRAQGKVGGCNTGVLQSWGVIIEAMGWS